MSEPMRMPREEELFIPQAADDVLDRLAQATDVLDLLRRADEVTPPEIDLWSSLILGPAEGESARLYIHSSAPITPALALAVSESMHEELLGCCGEPPELVGVRQAGMSCGDIAAGVIATFSDAFHDHVTQRGQRPVGITRAGATSTGGLTLQRWQEADRALEVTAWLVGTLANVETHEPGVRDPVTGQYSRAFFAHLLRNELASQQRSASEQSVDLLQLRRSSPLLADERPSPVLLSATAEIMRRELRDADVIARLDCTRMAALLPCTSPRNGLLAASRLGEALQDAGELEGWSIDIGISGMGMELVGADELLDQATHAMLSAGRGTSGHPFVYV